MEILDRADDELDFGLPPIAGGDDEGEGAEGAESDAPAGDEPGGDDQGEQATEEGAEGDEEQQQGDQQQEQQFDANGQPIGPGGYGAEGAQVGQSQTVPYSRFKEVNDRMRAIEQERQMLLQRVTGGDGQNGQGRQQQPEMPEQYRELDKGMGGYMRHYLDPVASHILGMQQRYDQQIADFRDESKFYRTVGRTLNERQAGLVEQTREALSAKLRQPVERSDALLFLRGHPEYGKLFVDRQAQQQTQLNNGVVAARRTAGKLGGRGTVTRGRSDGETVDLNSMPRAQRIAHFERVMGNTPV